MGDEKKLPLTGHLKELRRRLLLLMVVIGCTTTISFFITGYVFDFFKSRAPGIDLVFISVTEMLATYFKVSFYLGISLALPVIAHQILMFISPALNPNEKKYVYPFLLGVGFFFVSGVAFSLFVLLPPALNFLLSFGSDIARPMISVGNYISVLIRLLFWTGIIFEIPVVMYFLSKLNIVSPAFFSSKRKWAIVFAFVLAALITPTVDPLNQTIIAVPIVLLYEIGICLAKLAQPRRKTKIEAPEIQIQH